MNKVKLYVEQTNKSGVHKDGFYGYVLVFEIGDKTKRRESFEFISAATGNKTELVAITEALNRLTKRCEVTVYSAKGFYKAPLTRKWIHKWIRDGWKTAKGEPVANKEEWIELLKAMEKHSVITGPSGEHPYSKYMLTEMKKMEGMKNGTI